MSTVNSDKLLLSHTVFHLLYSEEICNFRCSRCLELQFISPGVARRVHQIKANFLQCLFLSLILNITKATVAWIVPCVPL